MDSSLLIALGFFVGALTFLVKVCAPEFASLIRAAAEYLRARADVERGRYVEKIAHLEADVARLEMANRALWSEIAELRSSLK